MRKDDAYHREFMASINVPVRQKRYIKLIASASPEVKAILKRIDYLLDKGIDICNNDTYANTKYDLLRCRYVLGMD